MRDISSATSDDLLASATMSSLSRELYYKLSWGVFPAFVLAILTLGVFPLVTCMIWLRGIIAQHHQQFWHLAEWLRLRRAEESTTQLQKIAGRVRFYDGLAVLGAIGLLAAGAAVLVHLLHAPIREVWTIAFSVPSTPNAWLVVGGICAASAAHWIHLYLHQQNVRRFTEVFNAIAIPMDLPPIASPRLEFGFGISWIISGGLLTILGAVWGMPLMLAIGAHRRYTIGGSVRLRMRLADRMRMLWRKLDPHQALPAMRSVLRTCGRTVCRAPVPIDATFCPRCGLKPACGSILSRVIEAG